VTYGVEQRADVTAHHIRYSGACTHFVLCTPAGEIDIETPLVGSFNVSNILAAASAGVALGVELGAIRAGVAGMRGVPGRLERIDEGQEFLAVVDFAHTPNALRQALGTARTMADPDGRVIVVFGSAGLRDREKRRMMGREAGKLADQVVITAEDPRTEDLDEVLTESCAGAAAVGKVEGVDVWRVADRGEAILFACRMAKAGDVVIACGKGHEQSMCFGTIEYPWDDREAMHRALRGGTLDTLPTAAPT
jgi:UDP-N-acetylmuramoyl-L-alanyl-D-glutamate--2,6-diaminopimelate ligase